MATEGGVYKVSIVVRKSEDKRWSAEAVSKIKGTPKEPVPGSGSSRVTAFARHREDPEARRVDYAPGPAREEPEVRATYIFKKDLEAHGATEGCPGCRAWWQEAPTPGCAGVPEPFRLRAGLCPEHGA